jgi:hypothetical protein
MARLVAVADDIDLVDVDLARRDLYHGPVALAASGRGIGPRRRNADFLLAAAEVEADLGELPPRSNSISPFRPRRARRAPRRSSLGTSPARRRRSNRRGSSDPRPDGAARRVGDGSFSTPNPMRGGAMSPVRRARGAADGPARTGPMSTRDRIVCPRARPCSRLRRTTNPLGQRRCVRRSGSRDSVSGAGAGAAGAGAFESSR